MPTGEERRQAVDRVLAENPYEDNPQLWIFMIWVCMIFRRNGRPDFLLVEELTGYPAEFLRDGFRRLSTHCDAILALTRWVLENEENWYEQE
ncbi:uncharacterized protein N7473_004862 [Penicillium subrubescens]|uniref:Uncharacterized protein n=1 Tax=Penicillium subrubescens TaxID=1316194 RepID=A0A1Q5T9E2_9EURO|nr:uncharacterized protein N7473_004862 [Penicillium subrubescens]KAJ5900792.1 hypothetical protein N7473_004862 [Penicillium subrubescens]OKO96866.1 hypothetical protein PENSUB_10420 [Penicillium subrubescens]